MTPPDTHDPDPHLKALCDQRRSLFVTYLAAAANEQEAAEALIAHLPSPPTRLVQKYGTALARRRDACLAIETLTTQIEAALKEGHAAVWHGVVAPRT